MINGTKVKHNMSWISHSILNTRDGVDHQFDPLHHGDAGSDPTHFQEPGWSGRIDESQIRHNPYEKAGGFAIRRSWSDTHAALNDVRGAFHSSYSGRTHFSL